MKKTVLILALFFTSGLVYAAGGPIPGVDISLERIPGGIYHTENDCIKKGGSIIHKNGRTYCNSAIKKRGHNRAKLTVSDEGRHKH